MRRQIKKSDSIILKGNWKYKKGKDNSKIGEALLEEQNFICAYTETYLGLRFDSKDIEHFNPTLKLTDKDGYENWFLVNHKLNIEKGSTARWLKHQDICIQRLLILKKEYLTMMEPMFGKKEIKKPKI